MRFTRKIPGIRLPLPNRGDPNPGDLTPWWSTLVIAVTYMVLMACALGIYLDCATVLGGGLGIFWREPRGIGVSNLALATAITALLFVYVGISFALTWRRRRGLGWKGVVGLLVTLGTLGTFQHWLNVQGEKADLGVQRVFTREAETRDRIEKAERELATLGAHPWAGKYTGLGFGAELTCWLAPETGFVALGTRPGSSPDDHPARRAFDLACHDAGVEVEGDRLRIVSRYAAHTARLAEYVPMEHGDGRYLVRSDRIEWFEERAAEGDVQSREIWSLPEVLRRLPGP